MVSVRAIVRDDTKRVIDNKIRGNIAGYHILDNDLLKWQVGHNIWLHVIGTLRKW